MNWIVKILSIALFLSAEFILQAQPPVWNPPAFSAIKSGYPFKLSVQFIPVDNNSKIEALANALADRIKAQIKAVEPKLILLGICISDTNKSDEFVSTFTRRFPRSIVLGITGTSVLSQNSPDSTEAVSALIVYGGDVKFSAVVESDTFNIGETILQTTQDKALLLLSGAEKNTLNKITAELNAQINKRVPIITIPGASEKASSVYFAGRRYDSACAAVMISGDTQLTSMKITGEQFDELVQLRQSQTDNQLDIEAVLALVPLQANIQQYKKRLQEEVGKLTPLWVLQGAFSEGTAVIWGFTASEKGT